MINWKNLEKFIVPGKVVTLVLLVDGEEIGAFSFNVDSLAFKEALEAASHLDPVKVAEKKKEPIKAKEKVTVNIPKGTDLNKIEPEPLDEEEEDEEEEEDVDSDGVPAEPSKSMTREQIMAADVNSEKQVTVFSVPDPVEKKPAIQQTLTDEW